MNRPENIPGLVFEEVAVKAVGTTADGPLGPVKGAMVASELHDDGTFSDKVFAPGYGEFFTAHEGDVEALALAVPTNALGGPPPVELRALLSGSNSIFDHAGSGRWAASAATLDRVSAAWRAHRARSVTRRLVSPTTLALQALVRAVGSRNPRRARNAALDLSQALLDLQLRYRPPAHIDRARFDLWARQVLVDAAAGDRSAVSGDVATLEWVRDRLVLVLDSVTMTRVDTSLEALRAHLRDRELGEAARTATQLRGVVAGATR